VKGTDKTFINFSQGEDDIFKNFNHSVDKTLSSFSQRVNNSLSFCNITFGHFRLGGDEKFIFKFSKRELKLLVKQFSFVCTTYGT
jgi:hypothetical protein